MGEAEPVLPPADAEPAAADEAADPGLRAALRAMPPPALNLASLVAVLRQAERHFAELAEHHAAGAGANNLGSAMEHAARAIMSAEAAAHAAKVAVHGLGTLRTAAHRIEAGTRHALGEAMHRAGVVDLPVGEHHTAAAAEGSERVELPAPDVVPSRFWRLPEPVPDKEALVRALRRGPVLGAELVRGPRTVRITRNREKL